MFYGCCPLWLCVAGALQFVLGLNGLALCGFGIFFFLGCDNQRIAGATLPYFNRPVTPFFLIHPALRQHVSDTCLPSPPHPASACQSHLSPFPYQHQYVSHTCLPSPPPHPLHQHVSDTCLPLPINICMSVTPVSLPQSTSICQWHLSSLPTYISMSVTPVSPTLHQ